MALVWMEEWTVVAGDNWLHASCNIMQHFSCPRTHDPGPIQQEGRRKINSQSKGGEGGGHKQGRPNWEWLRVDLWSGAACCVDTSNGCLKRACVCMLTSCTSLPRPERERERECWPLSLPHPHYGEGSLIRRCSEICSLICVPDLLSGHLQSVCTALCSPNIPCYCYMLFPSPHSLPVSHSFFYCRHLPLPIVPSPFSLKKMTIHYLWIE